MFIRAKLRNITREDAIDFARDNGIRRPEAIIREVVKALKQFRPFATKNGVTEKWKGRVEAAIINHLKRWGEWEETPHTSMVKIQGHNVENMRIEEAYKGNYHLYADIDGKEQKYVIGKNKEAYSLIEEIGSANLTTEQLKTLIEQYLLSSLS